MDRPDNEFGKKVTGKPRFFLLSRRKRLIAAAVFRRAARAVVVFFGRRVAEHARFIQGLARLTKLGPDSLALIVMQPKMIDCFPVAAGLGFVQTLLNGGGDDKFHAIDIKMMEIFARPDKTIRCVVLLPHFIKSLRRNQKPHESLLVWHRLTES